MELTRNMNLSNKMLETINVMQEHGYLKRYDGGFWSYEGIDLKPLYNGGKFMCMVPAWYCDVKILRALAKRGIVAFNKNQKNCILQN